MKLPRRTFLHLAAGAAALSALPRVARAETYPARTVTIIVPVAAGGTTDITARIIGQYMSQLFGQQFVIENVTGAGGTFDPRNALKTRWLYHLDGSHRNACLLRLVLSQPCV